jgi:tellurite resistance protein TerC
MLSQKIAAWVLFHVFVIIMLFVDMKVLHRKAHEIKMKEALWWSLIWILIALLFNAGVYLVAGPAKAMQFLSGYIIERSLSIDNIFVFLLVFTYFRVPARFQHGILFWGILGALVLRAIFIFAGVTLIARFEWIIYVFGLFLLYTGFKMLFQKDVEVHPEKSRVLRLVHRLFPVLPSFEEGKFFVRRDNKRFVSMMFVVLIFIETTDVIFAVDSIPAILAVTTDPFIVYTSNVFAIFGLRALYFAVAGLMQLFHYLHYGLSAILMFVGVKMLASSHYHINDGIALGIIGAILGLSILASVIWPQKEPAPHAKA